MRLTTKVTVVLTIAFAVFLATDAAIGVWRSVEMQHADTRHDLELQVKVLARAVAQVWTEYGRQGVDQLIMAADDTSSETRIRLLEPNEAPAGVVTGDIEGGAKALTIAPVKVGETLIGAVSIESAMPSRYEVAMARAPRTILTLLSLVVIAALVSVVLGQQVVGKPVGALSAKADEADRGRALAVEQLRRGDRLMTVGRLAAGLAHELGTPLNVVAERVRMARAGELDAHELPENYTKILEQTARMERIIRQLLDFARQRPPEKAPVDLGQVVTRTLDVLRPLADKARVTVTLALPEVSAVATIDPQQIEQALTHLVMNALQAMPEGGTLHISVTGADRQWSIAVRDSGQGISASDREQVFEPFFTTKPVGQGTGLGLSVVHGIIQEHGGRVDLESEPGRGSTFTVRLPKDAA